MIRKDVVMNAFQNFFNSIYFIVLCALLTLASSLFGLELFAFLAFSILVFLIALTCDSSRPVMTILLFIVFVMSAGNGPNWYVSSVGSDFLSQPTTIVVIIVSALIALFSLIYLLIKLRAVKNVFAKRTKLTLGLLAFLIALSLNGINNGLNLTNLAIGVMEGGMFLLVYVYFIHTLKDQKLDYEYFCNIASALILVIFIQLFAKIYSLSKTLVGVYKIDIILGWGISNNIGAMFALLIPGAMYKARNSKLSGLYLTIALIGLIGIVFSLSRAVLLFIVPTFLVLIIAIFYKNKGKIQNLQNSFVLFVALIFAGIVVFKYSDKIGWTLRYFVDYGFSDTGRFDLYEKGLNNFFSSPIFGVGFLVPNGAWNTNPNFFFNMYHNTVVQLLASSGILGLLAYGFMRFESILLFVKKLSIERVFMALSVFPFLLICLLDNHIFYFYPMFFYMIQLVIAEKNYEHCMTGEPCFEVEKGEKPRVLIPLVEAGMGHITPALAIAEAMQEKYGDKLEVVCLPIYAKSQSPILELYEKKLVKFVLAQNRLPLFGAISLGWTKFFGRKISLKYVMDGFVPYSYDAAVKYLETFDCDVMINTHWSTAYYAKFLKKKPLIIGYCPDATFNTMFDTEPDLLLISTESGKKKANDTPKAYNSQVETIPFCIKSQVVKAYGKRDEVRKNLGIDDRFTVVLADGGYGAGKLKNVVVKLLKKDLPINVIAVTGKNQKLYNKFLSMKTKGQTKFYPIGFAENMQELIVASDLFIGKSGAMTMAEPCYLGVPQIVSYCATPIETDIAKYYAQEVGSALIIKNVSAIVDKVAQFCAEPHLLDALKQNAIRVHDNFSAEKAVDFIYQYIETKLTTL